MLVGLTACEDGGPTEPDVLTLDDLSGVWEIASFSFTPNQGSLPAYDLMALGGAAALSIQPGGNFTGTVLLPGIITGEGDLSFPIAGVIRLMEDSEHVRIDFIPEQPPFFTAMEPGIEMSGASFTISDPDFPIDLDNDGTFESTTMRALVVRQ